MNSWNALDFLIFLIFVVNTMLGMVRGATKEIISAMGISAALIISIKFTVPLADFFNSSPLMRNVVENPMMNRFMISIGAGPITLPLLEELFFSLSLLVCFVGTYSICEAVMAYPGFVEMMAFPYSTLNRKVGGSLGAVRAYIFTLVILVILSCHLVKVDNPLLGDNIISGSYFAKLFQSSANVMNNLIATQNPDDYKEIYKNKDLYNDQNVVKAVGSDTTFPPPAQQEQVQPQTSPQPVVPQQ